LQPSLPYDGLKEISLVDDELPPGQLPRFMHRLGESQADCRERMALMQAEALERRQQELQQQSSPLNSPGDRIRLWERLHQVDLPLNPAHRLVSIIAANTGLSTAEVQEEQRLRATAHTAPPAPVI
jgi:hypothetical protein